MDEMIDAINEAIDEYGKDVIIIDKTPKMVDGVVQKDNNRHIIYDETEISTKARLTKKTDYEKNGLNDQYVKIVTEVASFKKEDAQYLKSGNELKYTDSIGNTHSFEMKAIDELLTHFVVILD